MGTPQKWYHFFVTGFVAFILELIWKQLKKKQLQLTDRFRWNAHVDEVNIQAVLLTSVNLNQCGRIEKRTIFTKALSTMYKNEHARKLVLAATKKTTDENPFVCSYIPMEDRWNVLVAALNEVSSTFGAYHLFSNQVSSFESCWYVMTIMGKRTRGSGRFFVTPRHPLSPQNDLGVKRVRLMLINEQELRKIWKGDIKANHEFFTERHEERWEIMKLCASIFHDEMAHEDGAREPTMSPNNPMRRRRSSRHRDPKMYSGCCTRIHIPVPLVTDVDSKEPEDPILDSLCTASQEMRTYGLLRKGSAIED